MNSPNGKNLWNKFKTMVKNNIDEMDYRSMVGMPWNKTYGVYSPSKGFVAAKQRLFNWGDRLRKTTGQSNVHEFTHAGQLSTTRYGGDGGKMLGFQKKMVELFTNIFDPDLNTDIFSLTESGILNSKFIYKSSE